MEETETVDHLKQKIKEANSHCLEGIDHSLLNLYLINVAASEGAEAYMQEVERKAQDLKSLSVLESTSPLAKVFEEGLLAETIHILIELPPRVLKRAASEQLEPETASKRPKTQHLTTVMKAVASPSNLIRAQAHNPILNGRPHTAIGPPIILFDEIFAEFHKNMKNMAEPTRSTHSVELPDVISFLLASSATYLDEQHRESVLISLLRSLLDQQDNTSDDGVCTVTLKNGRALLLLCEVKQDDVGIGDPVIRLSFSFSRWWSQLEFDRVNKSIRELTMCPTFLLAMVGPWLSVHGALLIGRDWVVQPLTDFIWLGGVSELDLDQQIKRVARLFDLLKSSLKKLEKYYEDRERLNQTRFPFPYLSSFDDEQSKRVQLTYKERVHFSSSQPSTAMFRAECDIEGAQMVFVKFTSRYNPKAHKLLEDAGLAPKLLACKELYFGYMVVMDWVAETSTTTEGYSKTDLDRIRKAKELLHENDYVFGDLRPNNIIKPEAGGVVLIDFDWCAKEGVGRYPLLINPDRERCGWHPEVSAGGLMYKVHDNHLFDRLMLL